MKVFGHQAKWGTLISFGALTTIILCAVAAPLIAPHGEAEIVADSWQGPAPGMWLGTDSIGRDMLTRMLYGSRMTLGLAVLATTLAFMGGALLGLIAAVSPRWLDTVLSRLVDLLMAIPQLILALVVLSVLGTSLTVLICTIALLDSTRVFRVSRSVAMNIMLLEYVEAARLRGENWWWIICRDVLPNAVPPLIGEFGYRFCFAFLFIASLSFIGLGVAPPYADWGGMVRENANAINLGNFSAMIPAMAIAVVTISTNLIVDWVLSLNGREYGETM
jgi:peptide/nickel transport system permease protein